VHNVDKPVLNQDLALVTTEAILGGKVEAAKAIGNLMSVWPAHVSPNPRSLLSIVDKRIDSGCWVQLLEGAFTNILEQDLQASSALHRFLSATIVEEWASSSIVPLNPASSPLVRLVPILQNAIASDLPANVVELQPILHRLRADCVALYATFSQQGKVSSAKLPSIPESPSFTFSSAQQVEASYSALLLHLSLKPAAKKTVLPQLEERYRKVESGIAYLETTKTKHERMVFAALGSALIALKTIPAKMTPLIRSVTNSIKVGPFFSILLNPCESLC
jgi:TATA-binding protein-associated factor